MKEGVGRASGNRGYKKKGFKRGFQGLESFPPKVMSTLYTRRGKG